MANPRSIYTPALGQAICAALREGFTVAAICRDPGFGATPLTVQRWRRRHPEFGALYREATAPQPSAKGLRLGQGRRAPSRPQIKQTVIERMLTGRSMMSIARDPDMPEYTTLRNWRRQDMDFHLQVQNARRFQLDVLLDEVIAARDRPHREPRVRVLIASLNRWRYLPYAATLAPPPTQEQMDAARAPPRVGRKPGIGHNSRRRGGEV